MVKGSEYAIGYWYRIETYSLNKASQIILVVITGNCYNCCQTCQTCQTMNSVRQRISLI